MNVGTTTVENLLRVARSEAAAGTAFVALHGDEHPPQIVAVPALGTSEGLTSGELAELVRQAAADPEFFHARVFVRSVQIGRPRTLVVAPLRDGVDHSMIGVVAEPDRHFEPEQLEVLEGLAQRLVRHLQVMRQLKSGAVPDEEPHGLSDSPPEESRSPEPFKVVPGTSGGWSAARVASAEPAPAESPGVPPEGSPATWWAEPDPLTGLSSLGQFFSRAGRMLAPDDPTTGALALVVVEVPDSRTMPNTAQVLRAQLRFSDPVARVDWDLLAVAILLFPAGTGDMVEQRLAAVVGSALQRPGIVRTAHVVAEPGGRRDVDELLREAISRLPGR